MPTHLYYAPAAKGKTAYAIQLARETAASLTAEVRVCVPTSLQARAWRERLAKAGGSIGIHVLTFDELVAVCLDLAGEAYTQLSEPVQYRLLRAIIDRLSLIHFAPLKSKPGFIQLLQQMITELKFAQIEPGAFIETAEKLGNEPRLTELGAIYHHYQEQLQAQGWADRVGMYWLAAESMSDIDTNVGRNWPLLIVDGFDDFTPIQLTLLKLLSGRVSSMIITLTQSATVDYPRYRRTREEIERAMGVRCLPLPDNGIMPDRLPELDFLASALFTQEMNHLPTEQTTIDLIEASDRTAEVRTALRWLKKQIVQDGFEPNEVALLANKLSPYRPFVRQIAAEFGLPVRLVDGLPLAENPLIAALLNLLRLSLPAGPTNEPELARRMVVSAWRSPYVRWGFLVSDDPDALDNIGRQQRVIRGLSQWQSAFEAQINLAESILNEKWESEEEVPPPRLPTGLAAQALHDKFNRFLNLIQPPTFASTMREFVGWLEDMIGPDPEPNRNWYTPAEKSLQITFQARLHKETAEADVAALQTLKDILRGFVWAEEALGQSRPVDYVYFFNELNGAINSAHYQLPTQAGQAEILVADAAQVRGLSFKAVAVMGLSEGEFPAVISEDPFLRDADRQAMRQGFSFSLEPSTQSAEREFFYEAITRPSHKLLLTRPTLADNGANWPPSPFWEAVHKLIGSPKFAEAVSSDSLIPIDSAASWPEYWQSLTQVDLPTQQLFEIDNWWRIERTAEIFMARQQATASDFDGFLPQLSEQLTSEFGPDHTWSASRLETYHKCGYFFFVQNVLHLEARPEPIEGLDATQLGTVYHHLFEAVYNAGLPEPLDEESVLEFVRLTATPILDQAPQKEGFRETPWWSQTKEEMIENVAASILLLEDGNYHFFKSEAAFGFDEWDKLVVETAVGMLQLRGFIDRIDQNEAGQLRIIDYKLGGPNQFTKSAFKEGKKLQLPLYALAAQETLGLGEVEEGFYWHFNQGKGSPFTLKKANGGVAGAFETAIDFAAQAVEKIRAGDFQPKPPSGGCPTYCPAATFCWHYSPPAW